MTPPHPSDHDLVPGSTREEALRLPRVIQAVVFGQDDVRQQHPWEQGFLGGCLPEKAGRRIFVGERPGVRDKTKNH